MTVDLAGDRKSVRGYFIADGRNDPYGQMPLPAGPHKKAFHLDPFWTAAQRNGDALGLVVYRKQDIPAIATTLASDFVLPMDVDGIWVGDKRVDFAKGKQTNVAVKPGEAVVLRKGNAVMGLRVPWSRGLDGGEAQIFLVNDGNPFGALRLEVLHVANDAQPVYTGIDAGAAFWVRIGSGIKTDEEFSGWRRLFVEASATAAAGPDGIHLDVAGAAGPVSVTANAPWRSPATLEPMPTRAVLELNGEDVGTKVLSER